MEPLTTEEKLMLGLIYRNTQVTDRGYIEFAGHVAPETEMLQSKGALMLLDTGMYNGMSIVTFGITPEGYRIAAANNGLPATETQPARPVRTRPVRKFSEVLGLRC